MAGKSTIISSHIMPGEIEDFEQILINLEKSSQYINDSSNITLQATLNLSNITLITSRSTHSCI
jgi:hypothetical protein